MRKTAINADRQIDINSYDSIEFCQKPDEIRELFLPVDEECEIIMINILVSDLTIKQNLIILVVLYGLHLSCL
jgi:hypothetical protein